MFENAFSRLVNGAIWGLAAGVVLKVARSSGTGSRPVMKSIVQAYVAVAERIRETTAEARESFEDLYAEAKAEQHGQVASSTVELAPATHGSARPGGGGPRSRADSPVGQRPSQGATSRSSIRRGSRSHRAAKSPTSKTTETSGSVS